MTKIILIGSSGRTAALASALAAEDVAFELAEDHLAAATPQGPHNAREELSAADYGMENVNALFEDIFGQGTATVPLTQMFLSDDDLTYGSYLAGPEFPGLHALFGIGEDEEEALDAEIQERMSFGRAYDALMRMLDVFSQVSGSPVTSDQRLAMALLLSNDDAIEAFATAAEDLIGSGLFE